MDFSRAFDKALTEYGISAKWLSQESGLTEAIISRFRKGRAHPTTKTLTQLLEALPMEVRQKYFSLVLGTSVKPSVGSLADQIEQMDSKELSALLMAIADNLDTGEAINREVTKIAG